MTPLAMIHEGVQALRRTENGQVAFQAGAAVATAWAALAEALLYEQHVTSPTRPETTGWGTPPMDLAAARHLDTVRPAMMPIPDHIQPADPGPHHPKLFHDTPTCSEDLCPNIATHTIEQPHGPVQVCTSHFTEWAQCRPV